MLRAQRWLSLLVVEAGLSPPDAAVQDEAGELLPLLLLLLPLLLLLLLPLLLLLLPLLLLLLLLLLSLLRRVLPRQTCGLRCLRYRQRIFCLVGWWWFHLFLLWLSHRGFPVTIGVAVDSTFFVPILKPKKSSHFRWHFKYKNRIRKKLKKQF